MKRVRIAGQAPVSRLVAGESSTSILSVSGYDGLTGWTNAALVSGGYRKPNGLTIVSPLEGMVLTLPAAGRVEFAAYMVSFMVRTVGGHIAMAYGPVIDTGGAWERHRFVLRWPMEDASLAWVFSVCWYAGTATSFVIDDIKINRIDKPTECAAYVDAVMTATGARVPYPAAVDMTLLPRTQGKITARGTLTVLVLGDSWSSSTSWSKWDALMERYFLGLTVRVISWALGGSTAATWNAVDMSAVFAVSDSFDLVVFGCISDPFTTADDWNTLIAKLKTGMPTTDVLICDRLGRGDAGDSAAFMAPICAANNVAFHDAEGSYDAWVLAGGTPVKPDGVHLETYTAESLGEGLAWRLGARAAL